VAIREPRFFEKSSFCFQVFFLYIAIHCGNRLGQGKHCALRHIFISNLIGTVENEAIQFTLNRGDDVCCTAGNWPAS
jgi:hypothetical protein